MRFALFLAYVVLSYIHPGEILPALAPYHVAFWVGVIGLAGAVASLARERDRLTASRQLWTLVVFAVVTVVSLAAAERWLGAPILIAQRFGPSVTMFALALSGVTSLRQLRIAAGFVVVLTTILVAQGAVAYHLGYNARLFLIDPDTRGDGAMPSLDDAADEESGVADLRADTQADISEDAGAVEDEPDVADVDRALRIRGLGMMHDPNDLAMSVIIALGIIGGMWRARWQLGQLVLACAGAALAYGMFLTRSRGGAVALLVVVWRFVSSRAGRLPALALLITLGAGVFAVGVGGRALLAQGDESASDRIVAWTEGLEMLKAQPLFGVGFGQFVDHHTLTAHNSLVLCFAETGFIGCFVWVGLLVVTLLELRGIANLAGDTPFDGSAKRWADGLLLSLYGFMAAAFFLSRTFAPTLYLILGLSAALIATARAEGWTFPLPAPAVLATTVLACEAAGIGLVYAVVKLHGV
jgi:hypothetical protein